MLERKKNIKKIAFYLPQFHSIPENDKWWGQGFTEWENVKKSKSQFNGHLQPEIPLNNNYYCLLDSEVQEWQSNLALEYGLDGFCYYHYWFEGKMLLEKPMEQMLTNSKIQIPFCVCWANETWARTWDGQEKDILIKQNYHEDYLAWESHFNYLLKFFKDSRYILHNGCPLLIIYKPYLIDNCKEMISYWKELAKNNGFNGLYIGYQHHSCFDYDMDDLGFDFGIEFEPFYTVREFNKSCSKIGDKLLYGIKNPYWMFNRISHKFLKKPTIYNYDKIWKMILNRNPEKTNIYPGAFTSWDNTPRRGNESNVFYQATPEKFKEYFSNQVKHAEKIYNSDYIFINAWNEWAEGAHLEPDEKNGYGYLEGISEGCIHGNNKKN